MKVGVVIPVGAGRRLNVEDCIESLCNMDESVTGIQVILDGHEELPTSYPSMVPMAFSRIPKHHPGQEQPRNVGVRALLAHDSSITHAWFVDSDLLLDPGALTAYREAAETVGEDTVLIGPYEWMPPGVRQPMPELHNDPRSAMFNERDMGPYVGDVGVALGCFGGNLVWPVREFMRLGGFHPMLSAGRVEDGDLGLRAASHRIPMALVPRARAYHMYHEINHAWVEETNRREVPLLHKWHGKAEEYVGLVPSAEDGARLDFVCSCGLQMNTLLIWEHFRDHPAGAKKLILPEGL
jgi:hypothetical protein